MFSSILKSKMALVIIGVYALLLVWWAYILGTGLRETDQNYLFGFIYAFIALIGGVNGFLIAQKYGGFKSLVGKGIIFFSLGLLGLWWGQSVWSYYNLILRVEVPYPSLADIGFFSIIPFYTAGMINFLKASGSKFSLKNLDGKLAIVLLPLAFVALAYFMFVRNLAPDFTDPIKTFFDFGYPLGEAIPISLALVTFYLSKGMLGGKMKGKVLFLIIALIWHIVTEYAFIYTVADGSYYNAGPIDLMYMTSFMVTSLSLLSFRHLT
jgi:diguanylate cyclase